MIAIPSIFMALPACLQAQDRSVADVLRTASYTLLRSPSPGENLVISTTEGQTGLFIRRAETTSSAPNLPLFIDLRDRATVVPFGIEERCSADATASDVEVTCAPGDDAAGVLLLLNGRLPRSAQVEAALATSGSEVFRMQMVQSGDDAAAPVPASGQQHLELRDQEGATLSLVILAPAAGGSLRLTGLHLAPVARPRGLDAGAWAWKPGAWREEADALLRDAVERNVKHLYVTLAIADGRVRHEAELISFVRAAAQAEIAVEVVEGDPRMVLAGGLAHALERARAIARYQTDAPADAQFSAIQYDIEPYVLPDWGSPSTDYAAWSTAVNALRKAVGEQVHLVLPFWVANEAAGAQFLHDVKASTKTVTIMDYRTDSALAAVLAEPLLHWGAVAGKPVRIALEAGPVASETEEVFVPAASGQLALIEKNGEVTATLFAAETVIAGAQMFAGRGAVRTGSEQISFFGNERQMFDAAKEVARAASAWDSFAGISFHGLSWPHAEQDRHH
jgi:hypothetical protein